MPTARMQSKSPNGETRSPSFAILITCFMLIVEPCSAMIRPSPWSPAPSIDDSWPSDETKSYYDKSLGKANRRRDHNLTAAKLKDLAKYYGLPQNTWTHDSEMPIRSPRKKRRSYATFPTHMPVPSTNAAYGEPKFSFGASATNCGVSKSSSTCPRRDFDLSKSSSVTSRPDAHTVKSECGTGTSPFKFGSRAPSSSSSSSGCGPFARKAVAPTVCKPGTPKPVMRDMPRRSSTQPKSNPGMSKPSPGTLRPASNVSPEKPDTAYPAVIFKEFKLKKNKQRYFVKRVEKNNGTRYIVHDRFMKGPGGKSQPFGKPHRKKIRALHEARTQNDLYKAQLRVKAAKAKRSNSGRKSQQRRCYYGTGTSL